MKTTIIHSGMAIIMALSLQANAQAKSDSLGLPGDNFDLYGALELFKESSSTEEFEKALNSKDKQINNLDLNQDGFVDYVKVVDRSTKNDKILILQDVISENESQDIAVLEMEKKGENAARLQIIGDEALYGKDYIIEPKEENSADEKTVVSNNTQTTVYVNVWSWPGVNWIYGPRYSVWSSPYHWRVYPTWWSPWSPLGWNVYYPYVRRYHHPYYHRTTYYHAPHIHKVYYGHRTTSSRVVYRNRSQSNDGNKAVKRNFNERGRTNSKLEQKRGDSRQTNVENRQERGRSNDKVKQNKGASKSPQNSNRQGGQRQQKSNGKQPRR